MYKFNFFGPSSIHLSRFLRFFCNFMSSYVSQTWNNVPSILRKIGTFAQIGQKYCCLFENEIFIIFHILLVLTDRMGECIVVVISWEIIWPKKIWTNNVRKPLNERKNYTQDYIMHSFLVVKFIMKNVPIGKFLYPKLFDTFCLTWLYCCSATTNHCNVLLVSLLLIWSFLCLPIVWNLLFGLFGVGRNPMQQIFLFCFKPSLWMR